MDNFLALLLPPKEERPFIGCPKVSRGRNERQNQEDDELIREAFKKPGLNFDLLLG
jgi:hypothetical protein